MTMATGLVSINSLTDSPRWTRRHQRVEDLRVHPILGIPDLLRQLGVDPAPLLARVGILPELLADQDNRLPFEVVGRLLAESARQTGCPHFGLLVGQRASADVLGLIGELACHAPTVEVGLRLLSLHFYLHDRGAVLTLIQRNPTLAELVYTIHVRDLPGAAQVMDGALAIGLHLMRGLCGPAWSAVEVTFAHARPTNLTPYQSYFRAPLRFDQRRSALVFARGCLQQAIPGADPQVREALTRRIGLLRSASPHAFTDVVRQILIELIVGGMPSTERVASLLGVSRRTLFRRLAAEATSLQGLMNEVRCELARQLLQESRMSLGEIAATLHFSQPSAFTRAFKQATGITPSACRAAAAAVSV